MRNTATAAGTARPQIAPLPSGTAFRLGMAFGDARITKRFAKLRAIVSLFADEYKHADTEGVIAKR